MKRCGPKSESLTVRTWAVDHSESYETGVVRIRWGFRGKGHDTVLGIR